MIQKSISVVIPCFNEEQRIHENIENIHSYLKHNFVSFEIIAVNDGSRDKTLEELNKAKKELGISVINNPTNAGKGKAVRDGVTQSSNEIIMFLDADLGIPIEELEKFIAQIEKGFNLAIASRFVPGLKITEPVPFHRSIMERVFRFMRMVIIDNYDIKDTQCGFKVFTRDAAKKIFPLITIDRFAFDAEVVYIAKRLNYKIKELPITLQNPRNSHIRFFRDPINMLADLIRIRLNDIKGKYQ